MVVSIPLGFLFFIKESLNPTRALKLEAKTRRLVGDLDNLVLMRKFECFLWNRHSVLSYGPFEPKVPSQTVAPTLIRMNDTCLMDRVSKSSAKSSSSSCLTKYFSRCAILSAMTNHALCEVR